MTKLRVKNWERFQHFKDRRPVWIKLYRELLDDFDINLLSSDTFKFLIQVWLLASEDPKMEGNLPSIEAISFRLRLNKNKCLDLLGQIDTFLISNGYQNDIPRALAREETEVEKETEKETEKEVEKRRVPDGTPHSPKTDHDFLEGLKSNPAYSHIDIDLELGRMDGWLSTRPERKKTRRFVINWLNKIDKPVGGQHGKTQSRAPRNPSLDALREYQRGLGIDPHNLERIRSEVQPRDGDPRGRSPERDKEP